MSIMLHCRPENALALFANAATAPRELWPAVAHRCVQEARGAGSPGLGHPAVLGRPGGLQARALSGHKGKRGHWHAEQVPCGTAPCCCVVQRLSCGRAALTALAAHAPLSAAPLLATLPRAAAWRPRKRSARSCSSCGVRLRGASRRFGKGPPRTRCASLPPRSCTCHVLQLCDSPSSCCRSKCALPCCICPQCYACRGGARSARRSAGHASAGRHPCLPG